ncbi:hypothetical protein ACFSTH_01100 [Paenibacillus yanchengensis]|uniref:Uncharacterized protein n=1 Tax=Paenibacillus yanchengensis TaxID=2035833 RepID=A0ABW4YF02_9BACL
MGIGAHVLISALHDGDTYLIEVRDIVFLRGIFKPIEFEKIENKG